jgi:hypothetical protein
VLRRNWASSMVASAAILVRVCRTRLRAEMRFRFRQSAPGWGPSRPGASPPRGGSYASHGA